MNFKIDIRKKSVFKFVSIAVVYLLVFYFAHYALSEVLKSKISKNKSHLHSGIESLKHGIEVDGSGIESLKHGIEDRRSGIQSLKHGMEFHGSGIESLKHESEGRGSKTELLMNGIDDRESGIEDRRSTIESRFVSSSDFLQTSTANSKKFHSNCDNWKFFSELAKNCSLEKMKKRKNLFNQMKEIVRDCSGLVFHALKVEFLQNKNDVKGFIPFVDSESKKNCTELTIGIGGDIL